EISPVHAIEAALVDFQAGQCPIGDPGIDLALAVDGGKIPHPAQKAAGNPRRAAGPARDLGRTAGRQLEIEEAGAAAPDALQLVGRIELQAQGDPEALAQWRGDKAGSSGGA